MVRKETTPKKSADNGKMIKIAVAIGIAALVVVFSAMAITREQLDYRTGKEKTSSILDTQAAVEDFWDGKVDEDITIEQRDVMDRFNTALERVDDDMALLATSNILKDSEAAKRYDEAMVKYGKVKKLHKIWDDVVLLEDISEDNLAKLAQSESEYLKTLAEELTEYQNQQKEYSEKYGGGGKGSNELIEAYSNIWQNGDKLAEKYKNAKIEDITGMSRSDITDFYATIKELNNYLSKKI